MSYFRRTLHGIILAGSLTIAGAAEFHPIFSISSSTSATDFYPATHLDQGPGIGFSANPPHDIVDFSYHFLWVTDACGVECDYFEFFAPPVLTIDLGVDRGLREISIWGYLDTNDHGAKKFRLRFATEAEGTSGFGTSIDFSPHFTAVNEAIPRQSFAFGRTVRARYVEMTITDNFYVPPPNNNGGNRVGLSEIAFEVLPAGDRLLVTAPRDFLAAEGDRGDPLLQNIGSLAGNLWSAELDAETGEYYFSLPTEGRIMKTDLSGDYPTLTNFLEVPGAVFHGLAIDAANRLIYALNSATDQIELYSLTSGSLVTVLAENAFQRPNEIVYDADRGWLVVSDSGLDKISIFNFAGDPIDELADASTVGAWGLAIDPENGDVLFSSHDLGQIWRWTPGYSPSLEQEGLSGPRGLGYDRWGRLYCVESGAGRVSTFGVTPATVYLHNMLNKIGLGARDISLYAPNDADGDFLPDDWEATQPGINLAFNDDPDLDGSVAGLEAALDWSVTEGPDALGFVLNSESKLELTHAVLKRSDLNYTVYLSDDLDRWQPANAVPVIASGSGLYNAWSYVIDPLTEGFSQSDKLFLQIQVDPLDR